MTKKTLFISPHPDDVEIGAGMSLLDRLRDNGVIKSVVVSLGNYPQEYDLRQQELEAVKSNYGYSIELMAQQPPTSQSILVHDLEGIIGSFEPDDIFIPHRDDRHQDHELVSKSAIIAARKVPNRYFYATPSTLNFEPNNYFIGDEELLKEKIRLISLFFTQAKPYNIPEEIRALARATGRKAMQYAPGTFFAEGFIANTITFADGIQPKGDHRSTVFSFDKDFFLRAKSRLGELLKDYLDPLSALEAANNPWEVLKLVSGLRIKRKINSGDISSGLIIEGDIYIDDKTKLPSIGYIKGPVYIGRNAEIQNFTTIEGPTYIGENARIGPYSIIRSSIVCPEVKIGQYVEVVRSVILDRTMISHKNIVGDSFIGADCWLPGEVSIANLRMDREPVKAYFGGERSLAGEKYGVTIEDGVKIPATVKILPGSYISRTMDIGFGDIINGIYIEKKRHIIIK